MIAGSSNGRTWDFGSQYHGSNPCPAAMNYGQVAFLGSGETTDSGKVIFRKIFQGLKGKQKVAILETPAGFEPNSRFVAQKIANLLTLSLKEFISTVDIIPARKKDTLFSPDNEEILSPIDDATFIFLGPGSPTYAVRQLKDSKLWSYVLAKWRRGATLCLSSAGALAMGKFCLPVYEIYKAGLDLYWDKGLNLLSEVGTDLSIITHWNNREGGKDLDTRFCFMGEKRFRTLVKLLPNQEKILGIDENTAIILDFRKDRFSIEGGGGITYLREAKEIKWTKNNYYNLQVLED